MSRSPYTRAAEPDRKEDDTQGGVHAHTVYDHPMRQRS